MVTIMTEIQVKPGSEPQWDELMRERMSTARKHSGWVGGQLLQPEGDPHRRVIVGRGRPATTGRSGTTTLNSRTREPSSISSSASRKRVCGTTSFSRSGMKRGASPPREKA